MRYQVWLAFALVALVAGCGRSFAPASTSLLSARGGDWVHTPIKHVVLVIQENRTFNDFFATYPGADGTTVGKAEPSSACGINQEKTIDLKESGLITKLHGVPHDLDHEYAGYDTARDGGAMDGFDSIHFGNSKAAPPECTYPYQYTDPDQIKPYWEMAKQYALAEHMYTTQGSSSFTAHQDLIAGDTVIEPNEALVDLPSCAGSKCVWGCDAPTKPMTAYVADHAERRPSTGSRTVSVPELCDAAGSARRKRRFVEV